MTTFSPSDAALEGFRLTRERPRVLLIWSVLHFAVSVLMAILMIGLGVQHLMVMEEAGAAQPDLATVLAELRDMAPVNFGVLGIGLIFTSIITAAVFRAVLEPTDDRNAFLRLGADELRLMVLKLIYVFILTALVFAVVLVAGVVAALASSLGDGMGSFAGLCVGLFAIGLLLFISIRLSLAAAITFAERRIAIFDSWALTRGMFWRLLGTYVLAVASIVVVALLGLVIFSAVASIAVVMGGGQLADAGAAFNPDTASFASYFTPTTLAYLAFAACLTAVYYAVITAPGAVAYRALKAGTLA